MNKISVVIPTLQKNYKILYNLIDTLLLDNYVEEIIIIDNSRMGINLKHERIRVIIPKENLYVNPSWNLGVEMSKCEIVALLNDDISIPENFCQDIVNQMSPDMGIIGVNSENCILSINNINSKPKNTNPVIIKTNYMDYYFGTAMFFYKHSYFKIPENIKIVYGDAWLFNEAEKHNKQNYKIINQIIFHIGGLSSSDKLFCPICKSDAKAYKHLTVKWYNRIFSKEYLWDGFKVRLFGITFKIKKNNAKGYCNE